MSGAFIVDEVLVRLFRFNTRSLMRMSPDGGAVPPVPSGPAHLYVHIPFCPVLCPYCSFHRVQHCHAHAVHYFQALRREIELYHAAGHRFGGVYFGGGTPTSEPGELLETIGLVRRRFGVREISVETNPRDLTPELTESLAAAGVTRLSVGVQSFDDRLLRRMERHEKYGSGEEIATILRRVAGLVPTLNVDLIYNQPTQTLASFERDLDLVRQLGATQVSCYPLMSSPTVSRRMAGTMGVPDPRNLRRFHAAIARHLVPTFRPVSAWCYTRGAGTSDEYIVNNEHYVGVGSGAFSYLDGVMYATTFSLPEYQARVAQELTGITARHGLSEVERMRYTLLIRLFGLELSMRDALRQYGPSFFRRMWGELLTLRLLGAVRRGPHSWRLSERGRFWLVLMMAEFFESVNAYREDMRRRVGKIQNVAAAPARALRPSCPANA